MQSVFVGDKEISKPVIDPVARPEFLSNAKATSRHHGWWVIGLSLVAVLLLPACATEAIVIPSGLSHPADPAALQAPLPIESVTLTSEPVQPPKPLKGGHGMHGMKH